MDTWPTSTPPSRSSARIPRSSRNRVTALRGICGRVDVPAVTALCRLAEALAAILDARMTEAFALLDEALLPVLAGQVPIEWAGDIYCTVVHYCHRLADLPRMRAWTQSMERWCDDFAASATYGGVCDVHRLQLLAATDDYRRLAGPSRRGEPVVGGRQRLGGR